MGHEGAVVDHTPVAANVEELDTLVREDAANQQAAVAPGRILFGAQDGHAPPRTSGQQASDTGSKAGRLGDSVIADMPSVVIEGGIGGSSAKLPPHEEVAEARVRYALTEHVAAEVGRKPRIRL